MAKYVDCEVVKDKLSCTLCLHEELPALIDSIPAADVRPVVRGKWTMHSDYPDRLICSECRIQFDVWHWEAKQMHYCPNCGADMREES